MSEDTKARNLEICKQLRRETGISISLCNEASKESDGNLDKARDILREKCIKAGEKYYKNPEKPLLYFATLYEEVDNGIKIVKLGCQSDFLIAGRTIEHMAKTFLQMKNFTNFTAEDLQIIDNELKFYSGLVKENIQLIESVFIKKATEEKLYIMKNSTPSNIDLYANVTVMTYSGEIPELEEEIKQQISINIHSFMKKSIVNLIEENSKPIKYTNELKDKNLQDFIANPLMTDRTKTFEKFLKDNQINIKISSIFCI